MGILLTVWRHNTYDSSPKTDKLGGQFCMIWIFEAVVRNWWSLRSHIFPPCHEVVPRYIPLHSNSFCKNKNTSSLPVMSSKSIIDTI